MFSSNINTSFILQLIKIIPSLFYLFIVFITLYIRQSLQMLNQIYNYIGYPILIISLIITLIALKNTIQTPFAFLLNSNHKNHIIQFQSHFDQNSSLSIHIEQEAFTKYINSPSIKSIFIFLLKRFSLLELCTIRKYQFKIMHIWTIYPSYLVLMVYNEAYRQQVKLDNLINLKIIYWFWIVPSIICVGLFIISEYYLMRLVVQNKRKRNIEILQMTHGDNQLINNKNYNNQQNLMSKQKQSKQKQTKFTQINSKNTTQILENSEIIKILIYATYSFIIVISQLFIFYKYKYIINPNSLQIFYFYYLPTFIIDTFISRPLFLLIISTISIYKHSFIQNLRDGYQILQRIQASNIIIQGKIFSSKTQKKNIQKQFYDKKNLQTNQYQTNQPRPLIIETVQDIIQSLKTYQTKPTQFSNQMISKGRRVKKINQRKYHNHITQSNVNQKTEQNLDNSWITYVMQAQNRVNQTFNSNTDTYDILGTQYGNNFEQQMKQKRYQNQQVIKQVEQLNEDQNDQKNKKKKKHKKNCTLTVNEQFQNQIQQLLELDMNNGLFKTKLCNDKIQKINQINKKKQHNDYQAEFEHKKEHQNSPYIQYLPKMLMKQVEKSHKKFHNGSRIKNSIFKIKHQKNQSKNTLQIINNQNINPKHLLNLTTQNQTQI